MTDDQWPRTKDQGPSSFVSHWALDISHSSFLSPLCPARLPMDRVNAESDLVASVLDRLIDHEPDVSTEPQVNRAARLGQVKESIKRDLEWLLNTKRTIVDLPGELRHLH